MEDSITSGLNGPADGPASNGAAGGPAGGSVSKTLGSSVSSVIRAPTADRAPLPAAGAAGPTADRAPLPAAGAARPTADRAQLPAAGAAGAGLAADPAQLPAAAGAGPAISEAIGYVPGRFADWAARRSIAPNSATGISFILGVCAAVWFSAGTRPDSAKAALALCGSYLAAWAAQLLIRSMAGAPAGAADNDPGTALASSVLSVAAGGAAASSAVGADRVARLTGPVCEFAIYAGLAVGAHAARWSGPWELATAAAILLSVRRTMLACTDNTRARSRRILSGGGWRILSPPGAGRLALIAVVASIWGTRMALISLLAWEIAATSYAMTVPPVVGRAGESVARYRDDGEIARWLGRLVRGNIAPLPPALAGLAATATITMLGLRDLPGVLVLTPAVAMLLAAPGSGDSHAGSFDWLVPAILQAGQFLYIAAVGFSCGVPAPVTFTLCAVIALRYLALAGPVLLGQSRLEFGSSLGWEGRMLVVGVGAMAGLTTFAYAALTAYLGVLICSKVMTSAQGVGR
jgi:hypothetical protein